MIDRNPYVIGVPLTGDAAFYGRQEIFHFIKDVLDAEKQNVVVLYGQRRIGKTSVLHQGARWLEAQGGFFPVYFDLQGKERLTLGQVLENLAQTIARRLEIERAATSSVDDDGRSFDQQFLPRALKRLDRQRLVLLFDEFDVLGDELAGPRAAAETLFPYLQGLIVNQPSIGFVFVVGRRIEELATHFQAIFKQAVYRRVGHLKPEDSRALITEPARSALSFDDDAVLAIQQLAAGHPYFTQLICFEAFNAVKASNTGTVTSDIVRDAVTRAIESGHGALNWFWEGLPRAERFILSAVAEAADESGVGSKDSVRQLLEGHRILLSGLELKDAPDRLVEWEMLRRAGPDAYEFVVDIVRRWVVREHPLSSARRDIDYVSKRAVRLFENAREAHSEGDLPYARDEYRRTLKANPNHSGAQLGLALVLYELGELDESLAEFEKAYAIDEMSARDGMIRVVLARAKKLEEQDHHDRAILEYQNVLRLVPAEETAARRLGSLFGSRAERALALADFGAARDAFRQALKYDRAGDVATRIQSSLTTLAADLTTSDDILHAVVSYEMMLELLPERNDVRLQVAAFYAHRGDDLDSKGEFEDAITSYTKAMAVYPQDSAFVSKLEATTAKLKERQTIGQMFEKALAAHRAGQFDEARSGWKKLIQLDVLSYRGENIAALLSETVTPSATPRKPKRRSSTPATREVRHDAQTSEETDASDSKLPPLPSWRYKLAKPLAVVAIAIAIAIATIAILLLWPASITGISLAGVRQTRVDDHSYVYAGLLYSNNWQRKSDQGISNYGFSWRSSDESIAKVSNGQVTGIAPGVVFITARFASIEASTQFTVRNFDIPALKAYTKQARIFAGKTTTAPERAGRKYATEIDSGTTPFIFLELNLDVHNDAKDHRGEVTYWVYRSGRLVIDRISWPMSLQRDQRGDMVWSALLGELSRGDYRADLMNGKNGLASVRFTVK